MFTHILKRGQACMITSNYVPNLNDWRRSVIQPIRLGSELQQSGAKLVTVIDIVFPLSMLYSVQMP